MILWLYEQHVDSSFNKFSFANARKDLFALILSCVMCQIPALSFVDVKIEKLRPLDIECSFPAYFGSLNKGALSLRLKFKRVMINASNRSTIGDDLIV